MPNISHIKIQVAFTPIERIDLKNDYNWSPVDAEAAARQVATGDLDRKNGFQVLKFVNFFGAKYKFTEKSSSLKVEYIINILPENINNIQAIEMWLVTNWLNF